MTQRANFKAQTFRLEGKVLNFGKKKHAAEFVKDCELISKFIAVKYIHGEPKMSIVIKNMEEPEINFPKSHKTQLEG